MSFRRYASYRDSGTGWIGQLPAHWQTRRLRTLVEIKKRIAGLEGADVLSITQRGIKVRDLDSNDGQLAESYAHYQRVEVGDFAMNHMDLLTGWVDLSEHTGVTSPDYRVFSLRSRAAADPRYLLRVLQNAYSQRIFYAFGQGASHLGRWRLPTDAFQDFEVPLPPMDEQRTIVVFLDSETAKIDALVEEQRRLIELLKEKRQAVISYAVTKGLNPSIPMKDSGVAWLGKVPAHWSVRPVKHLVAFQSGGTPSKARAELWEGNIPWASAKDLKVDVLHDTEDHVADEVIEEGLAQLVPSGSVVILVRGMMLARAFPVVLTARSMTINQDLKALLPRSEIVPEFLAWSLRSSAQETLARLDEAGHGTKALRMDAWASLPLPLPPKEEQHEIVAHVLRETKRLDDLTEVAGTAISLLTERRAALIAAAATGKIDVRTPAQPVDMERVRLRMIVGAAIIEALANKRNSGRTKPHKIVYLTEAHAGVRELQGSYLRQAAGPLDAQLLEDMERELEAVGHIAVEQPGGRGSQVIYRLRGRRGAFRRELDAALGSRAKVLDRLIEDLGGLDTRYVEAVTTLYAVWNDALLDGEDPSNDAIVAGFLHDWHPEKRQKFRAHELHTWLGWMRRHGLVPRGEGPKTSTGRLFV